MHDNEKTRLLNDQFRKSLRGGKVVATSGIAALQEMAAILSRVRQYDDFSDHNGPYGEHDFGSFTHDDHQIFWKIDYYDLDLNQGSPDTADSSVTARVLTIMLAEEY